MMQRKPESSFWKKLEQKEEKAGRTESQRKRDRGDINSLSLFLCDLCASAVNVDSTAGIIDQIPALATLGDFALEFE